MALLGRSGSSYNPTSTLVKASKTPVRSRYFRYSSFLESGLLLFCYAGKVKIEIEGDDERVRAPRMSLLRSQRGLIDFHYPLGRPYLSVRCHDGAYRRKIEIDNKNTEKGMRYVNKLMQQKLQGETPTTSTVYY